MRVIQTLKRWHLILAVVVVVFVALLTLKTQNAGNDAYITATVERGTVTESVAVSGYVEAKNTANLSFPTTGIVTDVMVSKGDVVQSGAILATLGARTLVAQRNEAVAALQKAEASYQGLLAGPTNAERIETTQSRSNAQVSYEQTVALENEKVKTARTALLSNDLTAYAVDASEKATAPSVSGSYTCTQEGAYAIDTYRSGSYSGYSYRYTGLENGNDGAYTLQTAPLGSCGLTIKFTEGDSYGNSTWSIPVPNTNSPTYATYKNAYDLALEARDVAIAQAQATLDLADASAVRANQDATSFERRQAQSSIAQAQAAVAAIDAQIAEKSIVAPFDGIVTDVDILPGETAGGTPIITLLAEDAFTLTARIPEVDITKIATQQSVAIVFDAKSDETLFGVVDFVSPLATEIDGVAYFETTVTLTRQPTWMRSGLNADIDIITHTEENTLTLPKRFIQTDDDGTFVSLDTEDGARTPVTITFSGNDGYAAITGLNAGDTVRAPQTE
tara:strand:- start:2014 stop:3525 length:1512 start_codon:yes stop_codon:yes gene_type:complete